VAYSPPTTFTSGKLLASQVDGNCRALRKYLHQGVAAGDLEASQWIDTRHVQPPVFEPYSGVQHGVTGHMGGYQSIQQQGLTFGTSYFSGNGLAAPNPQGWHELSGTAIEVQVRRAAKCLYHWWVELEVGPDDLPYASGRRYPVADRLLYIAPYIGNLSLVRTQTAQEAQQTQSGWATSFPIGARDVYSCSGGAHQRDGTVTTTQTAGGRVTFGLACYSQVDRAVAVNWGVAVETFYL